MPGKAVKNCECHNVKIYDGVWRCMLCFRVFVPIDLVEYVGEQLDVEPVKEVKAGASEH